MKEELKQYLKENLEKNNNRKKFFKNFITQIKDISKNDEFEENEYYSISSIDVTNEINDSNIDKYIENNENKYNDFQTTLFKMIDDRNLKDSDVYNKVHIDRRLFSKIRNDKKLFNAIEKYYTLSDSQKEHHPSKETVILLGLSLELNEQEIDILLNSASYSLPKNNRYDLIIRFCFINKIYKISTINELLFDYNCKLFDY